MKKIKLKMSRSIIEGVGRENQYNYIFDEAVIKGIKTDRVVKNYGVPKSMVWEVLEN